MSFVPKLVEAYKGFKSGQVDVVFVSSDRSADMQRRYMEEGNFVIETLKKETRRGIDWLVRLLQGSCDAGSVSILHIARRCAQVMSVASVLEATGIYLLA